MVKSSICTPFFFLEETLNHMFLEDAVQALSAFRASGNRPFSVLLGTPQKDAAKLS